VKEYVFSIIGEAWKPRIYFSSLNAAQGHVHDYMAENLEWEASENQSTWESSPTKWGDKVSIVKCPRYNKSQIKRAIE
jgi:hypothetical protein